MSDNNLDSFDEHPGCYSSMHFDWFHVGSLVFINSLSESRTFRGRPTESASATPEHMKGRNTCVVTLHSIGWFAFKMLCF